MGLFRFHYYEQANFIKSFKTFTVNSPIKNCVGENVDTRNFKCRLEVKYKMFKTLSGCGSLKKNFIAHGKEGIGNSHLIHSIAGCQ